MLDFKQGHLFEYPFLETIEKYCSPLASVFLSFTALYQGIKDIFINTSVILVKGSWSWYSEIAGNLQLNPKSIIYIYFCVHNNILYLSEKKNTRKGRTQFPSKALVQVLLKGRCKTWWISDICVFPFPIPFPVTPKRTIWKFTSSNNESGQPLFLSLIPVFLRDVINIL